LKQARGGDGIEVTAAQLAAIMLRLQSVGCHNVNFVTPEHVVPQILEALLIAIDGGLRLPLVYNTSSYDSMDSIRSWSRCLHNLWNYAGQANGFASETEEGQIEYSRFAHHRFAAGDTDQIINTSTP
jgi:hypothetical protein